MPVLLAFTFTLPFLHWFGMGGDAKGISAVNLSITPPANITCIPCPPGKMCLQNSDTSVRWCPPSVSIVPPPIDRLTCGSCSGKNKNSLCLDIINKASFCTNITSTVSQKGIVCVSCAQKISPPPQITPPSGCYYAPGPCNIMCTQDNPNCCQNYKRLICPPSITPIVSETSCAPQGRCTNGSGCPNGTFCTGIPLNYCLPTGCPYHGPICLSVHTTIATAHGDIPVTDVKAGTIVWSLDKNGKRIAEPVLQVAHTSVEPNHKMIHLVLSDGRTVDASYGHPTIDGRTVDQLKAGDTINATRITQVQTISYDSTETYDLLPDGKTGYYFANGVPLASTLKR